MTLLYVTGAYIAVGIGVAIWLYEPERDGTVWRVLLWPLEVAAHYGWPR